MFWKRFEKSAERILTLSLAFTSAPQWMRCSAHSWCPVRTATWRGVLHSWRYTTRVLVRNVVLRVQSKYSAARGTLKTLRTRMKIASSLFATNTFVRKAWEWFVNVIIIVQRSIWWQYVCRIFLCTLSLELNLAPLLRSSSRAGRLPPLQAQCTAVASSYEHTIKKLYLRIIMYNKWDNILAALV